MTNNEQVTEGANARTEDVGRRYDLEQRTALFGEQVIAFVRTVPRGPITNPLINQLVRSATSIGANYCEADDAESRKDFRHKISLCRKEARETKYWLRMMAAACELPLHNARILWTEAKELHLIFAAIIRKCDSKQN